MSQLCISGSQSTGASALAAIRDHRRPAGHQAALVAGLGEVTSKFLLCETPQIRAAKNGGCTCHGWETFQPCLRKSDETQSSFSKTANQEMECRARGGLGMS